MQIKELPENVASKIAAGEVVERPVSVVKELIENSIDAGASQVLVRVREAGKALIDVQDNGVGIPAAEVKMAIKRYATSKIASIDDLNRIKTLGFRGEALASIASVSRFTLMTRSEEEAIGVSLIIEAGRELSFSQVGMPQGTHISVQNLFFNVPARLKFLKTDVTERRLISELISHYALIYPHTRFHLEMEGKEILISSGNGAPREILSLKYDLDTAKQFLAVNYRRQEIQVDGFISPLGITRSNRKEIRFSVNGRPVSDGMLTSAVLRAYHGYLMVGRYPIAILNIAMPPEELDVNVHPAKAEIKFRNEKSVFSAVHSAVRKTMLAYFPVPELPDNTWSDQSNFEVSRKNEMESQMSWVVQRTGRFSPVKDDSATEEHRKFDDQFATPLLRLIGQLGRTYIAAEGPDGLYLIDQHAAHERILYERMQNLSGDERASQLLLEPAIIHVPPGLDEVLESRIDVLNSLGFEIQNFGAQTYKITAVPAIVRHMDPQEALLSSIETDDEDQEFVDDRIEKMIIAKICKRAAVKGGQVLSVEEQNELLRNLEKCESPRTCPHGRPTMIYLSVTTLEKQFGRRGSL